MTTYVLPQTLVFQDLPRVPSVAAQPLSPHISGGHAFLLRYAVEDERDLARLDYYDPVVDQEFEWPQRPAGATVDASYVKLFIKDALLEYFSDSIGSGSAVNKVANYNNRVRIASVNLATNGVYPRAAALLDRDVRAGDVIKIRVTPTGEDPVTLWTYVRELIGDAVAAVMEAAAADASNAATAILDVDVTQTGGVDNATTATADASAYDGLPSGKVVETYRVIVTESSAGSDYTTAKLRVLSGSGTDDQLSVTPAAKGDPTDIGTRGLQLTFDYDENDAAGSQEAEDAGADPVALLAGQEWTVTVTQAFTAPVATASGTYDDTNSTTYIVTVTKGGVWADLPQITVSTTNNVDRSGPTDVTGAAVDVDLGTHGLSIQFSGAGLRKGDRYYVEVTGIQSGPMRTIVLGHTLPSGVDEATDMDLTLYIRKPSLEVGKNRLGEAPNVNFSTSETEITVKSGITAFDTTWTDDGVPVALPVKSSSAAGYGVMYVEYRAWRSELVSDVFTVDDVSGLDDAISGPLHPDNPLKWGVFKTLQNANGTPVKFTAVADPSSLDAWAEVIEALVGVEGVYGLVPLTRTRTVLDLFEAHCEAMSAPTAGLWRVLWTNLEGLSKIPVVHAGSQIPGHTEGTTSDNGECLATFADDPNTAGSQYTLVRCPAGNGDFVTNGVRPGDTVRAFYLGDGFGNETWSEFTVDEVQTEDQLRVLVGPDAPQAIPSKIEIWRDLNATEEAQAIAANAGAWGNRRVRAVWPDQIESSGTVMEGYFLCAALAGLTAGVLPQQGLTRLEISGFTDVTRTTAKFNRAQLDIMAGSGTWIVTKHPTEGRIYTRHAVTTGSYADIVQREEMYTRNIDSVSFRVKDTYEPYIGVTNVVPNNLARLRTDLDALISLLTREGASTSLGGQLISGTITRLEPHPTLADRAVINVSCRFPFALNNVEVHLE